MKNQQFKEKRKHHRKKCAATVACAAYLDTNYTAIIRDISQGGVFIDTENLLDVGQEILMTIQFPEEPKPISIIGEVVWHNSQGMGVRFKTGFDTSLIEELMDETQPAA